MNTKHFENPCREGQTYVSPCSKVVEFQPEGVLCGSYKSNNIDDAIEEEWPGFGY